LTGKFDSLLLHLVALMCVVYICVATAYCFVVIVTVNDWQATPCC